MLLEHNVPVYTKLEETLSTDNKAIIIMGTGVGKTYVTTEYLDKHNLKALLVSPRKIINSAWSNHTNRVETITYQKFSRIYKQLDYKKYDLVVADEAHHIGAKKWGEPFQYLINNNIIKVIGLTENAVRYLDGGRDVGEEVFDGNVCQGETVQTAIEKGILNKITYVGAYYNTDGIKEEYRGKITDKLYKKLDLALNNTPKVQEILLNNMPSGNRKGIVFVSSIEEIPEAIKLLTDIYPNTEYRVIHSKQSDRANQKSFEWFNSVESGYMFSVNMISEGVHIKGVNTLIMLRKTSSPSIFAQQMGRCLDAKSKKDSILFDLVNNKNNLKLMFTKDTREAGIGPVVSYPNLSGQQIIVKDYTKDICEVLEEIKLSLSSAWKKEEDDIIIDYYTNHYSATILNDLKKLLPNRNKDCISHRAFDLGVKKDFVRGTWSEEEDDYFNKCIKNNPDITCPEIIKMINDKFPNNPRTRSSIIKHCRAKGISLSKARIRWDEEEKNIVLKHYPTEGTNCISRLPGKTTRGLVSMAQTLGVTMDKKCRHKGRKVLCVELNKTFENIHEATLFLKVKDSRRFREAIVNNKIYHNYHWQYVTEEN